MSSNVCLDPRPFYNFENLSCDLPQETPRTGAGPQAPLSTGQPVHPGTPASLAPQLRELVYFRSQLLQQAATGTSQAAQTPINPLALSLLALLPFGCGSDDAKGGFFKSSEGPDASADGAGGASGGSAGTGGAAGSNGGSGGRDASIQDGPGSTPPPIPGQAVLWSTTPCGNDGAIVDLDEGVGVCNNFTDNRHHLFSWNSQSPLSTDGGTETGILELGFAPDQVLRGSSGKYFITHYGNGMTASPPSPGLAIVDQENALQEQKNFTQLLLASPMATSKGNMVQQVSPSFPKGLAEVGDRLFIATSNLMISGRREANPDGGTSLNIETYFNPGTVLIYNTASSSWEHYLVTTDFNPTSMAAINGRIYVVNSGDVDPTRSPIAATPSSIDVINPHTLQIERNIPLGIPASTPTDAATDAPSDADLDAGSDAGTRENLAAGIQGEIAVSSDGNTIVLPTSDNSGRIIVVDLASGNSRAITVVTGDKVLLTGLSFHPSNQFVYVGNFNDGKIYTVDLSSGQVLNDQTLDSNSTDFSGISDGLWQSASVFMGVGPDIYRLPVQP